MSIRSSFNDRFAVVKPLFAFPFECAAGVTVASLHTLIEHATPIVNYGTKRQPTRKRLTQRSPARMTVVKRSSADRDYPSLRCVLKSECAMLAD